MCNRTNLLQIVDSNVLANSYGGGIPSNTSGGNYYYFFIIFLVYHYLYLLMLSIDLLLLLLFFRRNFIYIQFVQNKIINKFIDDNIIWLTRSIQMEIRSICFDSRFYAIVLINFSFRTAILSLNLNRKKKLIICK